ncbi:PR5-like receptor kinase [Heracleum sosnowskyi]|uniref:PR5-like receptor kinase n=1 Tax=Heracleum sosnowskyi TaxID=360622 RepID=A0AAD8HAP5_9APIA|nr:PR5-like receptor kinase [Heracleum sosnowskyi]
MAKFRVIFPFLSSICLILTAGAYAATTFTLINQCAYPIWPGLLSAAGTSQLPTTGFALQPGQSNSISIPTSWSGRLWARTSCSLDSTGKFTCETADCGSGKLECAGSGATPPASLAEFTLNGGGGLDFYDVSLVDGYNVPITVEPKGGKFGNCMAIECATDLNAACPKELAVVGTNGTVACKSACEAFGDPKYCCSGAYNTPDTCGPSTYSQYFKSVCPQAYSYAYDDGSSTFTCGGASEYVITFCHSSTVRGSPSEGKQVPADPNKGSTSESTVAVALMASFSILYFLSS